jgi:hypothetical protein
MPDVSRKRGGLNLKGRTSNEETEHWPVKMRPLLCLETLGSLHTVGWHITPEEPLVEFVVKLKVGSGEKPVRCV